MSKKPSKLRRDAAEIAYRVMLKGDGSGPENAATRRTRRCVPAHSRVG